MRIPIVLLAAAIMGITACTKVPGKIQSPSFKIDVEYRDGAEVFPVRISAGIANENNNRALGNVKGSVSIVDPEGDKTLVSFPFVIDMVLPFAMGIIEAEKTCSRDEIDPLVRIFEIDFDEMLRNKGTDTLFIDDNKIKLDIDSYEKHDIITLLEGKVHEENK